MPSPFPGMDPYLETPHWWPTVHHGLIHEIMKQLNQQLRPKYFAAVEERVYVSDDDDPAQELTRVPDVRITELPRTTGQTSQQSTNVAEVAQPIELASLDDEITESRVEIVDAIEKDVVAVIEVMSPSNKVGGSRGRESYHQKRSQVKNSPSHWLEIDLLRMGVGFFPRKRLPEHEYLVYLSRADGHARRTIVWPIRLRQRLPVVAVPLRNQDPDARIDLQAALENTYEDASFALRIDYQKEPDPPLEEEHAAWAHTLLKSMGLC